MFSRLSKYFGPSTLITAAFIGPGTLTVCTLSGVNYGYSLLWALLFSILATMILQEMSLRLGIITQNGLGEAIRNYVPDGFLKILFSIIVFSAIVIGNATYEAGNISGAVLGIEVFQSFRLWPLIIGILAFAILFFGKYRHLEKVLIGLVLLMSICFLITVFCLKPSLPEIFTGLLPGKILGIDFLTVMAIVGTTVVPYNLFLHASIISEKYKDIDQLKDARVENVIAIALGGLISMLIMIVAAAALHGKSVSISNAADMAQQLEPLLGNYAKYLFGIGLFAAGLSSAITAPIAAAFAASGLFAWSKDQTDIKFRSVWIFILLFGVALSTLNISFISIIKFAQIANGILLPVIAVYLLYLANQKSIMSTHRNNWRSNLSAVIVITVCVLISARTFIKLFDWL